MVVVVVRRKDTDQLDYSSRSDQDMEYLMASAVNVESPKTQALRESRLFSSISQAESCETVCICTNRVNNSSKDEQPPFSKVIRHPRLP